MNRRLNVCPELALKSQPSIYCTEYVALVLFTLPHDC